MPNVKVCIWNIQNYGAGDPAKKYGESSKARNLFIAKFLKQHEIDVLLVQEVSRTSVLSLVNLARALDKGVPTLVNDWVFSFCGSAVASNGGGPPSSSRDLTFRTDARSEGYAVLWRQSRTRFSLVPALHDVAERTWPERGPRRATTPLNLSVEGRPTEGGTLAEFRVSGGYTPTGVYPFENNVRMDHWPELVMPATSSLNPVGLQWARARRPVSVVVRFANGTQVPVSAYHAPSNAAAAGWGVRLSALARELYVVNQFDANTGRPDPGRLQYAAKAVMGGDYNKVVGQAEWPGDYANYTGAFNAAAAGGANCTEAPAHNLDDDARRTTVRLLQGQAGSPPVAGGAVDDYLTLMIDLAFFRTGSGITAERVNVVQELVDRFPSYTDVLRQYMKHLTATLTWYEKNLPRQVFMDPGGRGPQLREWTRVRGRWVQTTKPMFSGNWGGSFLDWNAFKTAMRTGTMTPRLAAEFYQIFISDHLPLVVTIPDA